MRIVDVSTFPDRSEHRETLLEAIGQVDLGDASQTEPLEPTAAVGLAYPEGLGDEEIQERAEQVRAALQDAIGGEPAIRVTLADGPAPTSEGSPDHIE